jgi:lipopolysaccharide export system protein LptA
MIRLAPAAFCLVAGLCAAPALAQGGRVEPSAEGSRPSADGGRSSDGGRPSAFSGLSGSGKEPIKIDADRLDVFDKEQRAVFSGNVVAVQGDSTMKCTSLTVLYEQSRGSGAASPAGPAGGENGIRKIDCKGPVTVTAKTQVATSDNATFDRVQNKIVLTGNAALSDGPNVTKGDRVVYDLNTSRAYIEGRVRALIVPGSSSAPERKTSPSPARAVTN